MSLDIPVKQLFAPSREVSQREEMVLLTLEMVATATHPMPGPAGYILEEPSQLLASRAEDLPTAIGSCAGQLCQQHKLESFWKRKCLYQIWL